jgi:hypothetical protein
VQANVSLPQTPVSAMGTLEFFVATSYQVSGIVKLNCQEPGIRGRPNRPFSGLGFEPIRTGKST